MNPFPRRRSMDLSSLLKGHRNRHSFAVAQYCHLHQLPHFAGSQRVGEVVKIVDHFVAELHEHVAALKSGLGRGRIGLYVAEAHPRFHREKSGIEPKYGP